MRRTLLCLTILLLAGCNNGDSSGPEGGVGILSEQLVACTSGRFCCVKTRLVNTGRRTVDVSIRWRAFNAAGVQFADALDFIPGLAPHVIAESISAFFGAHVTSCSQISRFERFELTVFD